MVDTFEERYRRLLDVVRHPTADNWYQRYDGGLRLERVEQGRRLVVETPVLPEVRFMLDLQNVRAGPAWNDFIAAKSNLVRFAASWSDPDWKFSRGTDASQRLGDSAERITLAQVHAETHDPLHSTQAGGRDSSHGSS